MDPATSALAVAQDDVMDESGEAGSLLRIGEFKLDETTKSRLFVSMQQVLTCRRCCLTKSVYEIIDFYRDDETAARKIRRG